MEKFIGLDVHAASTTFAVIGSKGKRLSSHVVETNGQALVEQLKAILGSKHVCLKVFKEVGEYKALRELARTHAMVVQDVVRVQNRIKALLRSRGVTVSGKSR